MKPPIIVVLNQVSVATARQLMTALPGSQLYGLVDRTIDVDVSFTDFGDTLRQLYRDGVPIVGLCAAGILIRTLAPILSNTKTEPPVIAVAADGSAVVPLLGGMTGVNNLAEQIAAALNIQPAITTTGKILFNTVLPDPPAGYRLANPEHVKAFIANLIGGASVSLEGDAPWLTASDLAFCADGKRTITVTTQSISGSPERLVYHPTSLVISIDRPTQFDLARWLEVIIDRLATANLALPAVACIVIPKTPAGAAIIGIGKSLNLPIRLVDSADWQQDLAVISNDKNLTILSATQPIDPNSIGQSQG
ncbi:MAG: precorrin-3B C(17)-methyltransferase, partial [Chamaesiphon sp.]|nr:precorrin-3B C(17)-methyltransferase [Chamaesiphon sp.]